MVVVVVGGSVVVVVGAVVVVVGLVVVVVGGRVVVGRAVVVGRVVVVGSAVVGTDEAWVVVGLVVEVVVTRRVVDVARLVLVVSSDPVVSVEATVGSVELLDGAMPSVVEEPVCCGANTPVVVVPPGVLGAGTEYGPSCSPSVPTGLVNSWPVAARRAARTPSPRCCWG
ncbi:MAG: hypothetical protein R2755_32655 [Acidimicrobiales bacterium]